MLTRTSPMRTLEGRFFNRYIKMMHRDQLNPDACTLHKLIAHQMLERRKFVKRPAAIVLEVGAHSGWYLKHLLQSEEKNGLKQYIQTDISEERLNRIYQEVKPMLPSDVEFIQICCDEEIPNSLELPDRSVDMAVSVLSHHWVNDLEAAMVNIRRALKRDAFLLLTMFGANTLYELRSSFSCADSESEGGLSPHVSPMVDGAGMSQLMLQSGFTLPTVDMDRFVLAYPTAFHLMEHLSAMGESGAHIMRRPYVSPTTLLCMASVYEQMYAKNGLVPATFEIFHAIGWSPSPDQPKPLERGSADVSLAKMATQSHKAFNETLNQLAKDPENLQLQRLADEQFATLKREMEQEQKDREGLESSMALPAKTESISGLKLPPAPTPPFQEATTAASLSRPAAPLSSSRSSSMADGALSTNAADAAAKPK